MAKKKAPEGDSFHIRVSAAVLAEIRKRSEAYGERPDSILRRVFRLPPKKAVRT